MVNLAAVCIGFFAAELYLRMRGFDPYVRTYPGQSQTNIKPAKWAQVDPFLGWTVDAQLPDINPQGFRDTKDFNKVDLKSGKIRVMILGDSFMYGHGVRADENVSSLLQKRLNDKYEFFNLSMRGWGIDQMYLAYQRYKDVIHPDIVILAYIDDDVTRVLTAFRYVERLEKPSFDLKDGGLVPQKPISNSQRFLNAVMKRNVIFSLLMRYIYLTKDARPIVKKIFLDMANETEQRKAKFVVVRIPAREYPDSNIVYRRLLDFKDSFRGTDALYLEPFEEIKEIPNWKVELYLEDSGHHLSVKGNQSLADYIYRHVFEKST